MLQRFHIQNFKCLRDVTVELGDFTVLIGPNDSGKSSFLQAIRTCARFAEPTFINTFRGDSALKNLAWRRDKGCSIGWEVTGSRSEQRFVYQLELPVDRQRPSRESLEVDGQTVFSPAPADSRSPSNIPGVRLAKQSRQGIAKDVTFDASTTYFSQLVQEQPAYSPIADELKSSIEYRFELGKLAKPSVPAPGITLDASGDNLAAVLDVMQNSPDHSSFAALQKALHGEIPTLSGFVLPPAAQPPGAKALEFILSGNGQPPVTIPASLASGGALLLTAYLTLAYTQSPGLILIEEPENGLHPSRLQTVVELLRKMSRGEIGTRKRQIVITTHNPLLLNYATPDEVRVFVRDPAEGTRVIPMTEVPDIDRLLKEFALGELWYLLGEEKLFKEQPA